MSYENTTEGEQAAHAVGVFAGFLIGCTATLLVVGAVVWWRL
jgi:hypothetical protein